MAIYGLNFNGTHIPDGVGRHFRKQIKLPGMRRGENALLAGVAQSETERDEMLVQASNGHRKLHVHPKKTAGGTWYGVYTHHSEHVEQDPFVTGALQRLHNAIVQERTNG